jgi:hypothetical protein
VPHFAATGEWARSRCRPTPQPRHRGHFRMPNRGHFNLPKSPGHHCRGPLRTGTAGVKLCKLRYARSALGPCHNGRARAWAVTNGRPRSRGTAGRRPFGLSSSDDADARCWHTPLLSHVAAGAGRSPARCQRANPERGGKEPASQTAGAAIDPCQEGRRPSPPSHTPTGAGSRSASTPTATCMPPDQDAFPAWQGGGGPLGLGEVAGGDHDGSPRRASCPGSSRPMPRSLTRGGPVP